MLVEQTPLPGALAELLGGLLPLEVLVPRAPGLGEAGEEGRGTLEIIERDRSDGANRLRADIAWDCQDWAATGRRLEALLNDRWRDPSPLTPSEQTDLIRAAIAYSLNSDLSGAQRLGQRYGAAMARTEQAAAFEVLTRVDNTPGDVRFSDLASLIASIDTLDSFMEPFRARFQGGGES